jgi:hypothetical protein
MLIYIWSTLPTSINPPSAGGTYSAVAPPRRGFKHTTNITPSDTSTTNTSQHTSLQPLCDTSGISVSRFGNTETMTYTEQRTTPQKTNKKKSSTPKSLQSTNNPKSTPTPTALSYSPNLSQIA